MIKQKKNIFHKKYWNISVFITLIDLWMSPFKSVIIFLLYENQSIILINESWSILIFWRFPKNLSGLKLMKKLK